MKKKASLGLTTNGDTTFTSIVAVNIAAALSHAGANVQLIEDGKLVRFSKDSLPENPALPDLEATLTIGPSPLKERPLEVAIINGLLIISIGIDTLAFAAQPENGGPLYCGESPTETRVKVGSEQQLAEDVKRALEKEDEVGGTLVNLMLDEAIVAAHTDGSTAFEEAPGRVL